MREYIPDEPYDLYFSSGVPYSHLTPRELTDVLSRIFTAVRRNRTCSVVVVDVLGRYSIEWADRWDRSGTDALTAVPCFSVNRRARRVASAVEPTHPAGDQLESAVLVRLLNGRGHHRRPAHVIEQTVGVGIISADHARPIDR
ncbi:hypothetical protein [Streptomyces achromogenes]|uniref:hypothetical protein n=1 Tax=Streptomyces achromogenes TaxID=67255 RepID=UPI0036FA68B0